MPEVRSRTDQYFETNANFDMIMTTLSNTRSTDQKQANTETDANIMSRSTDRDQPVLDAARGRTLPGSEAILVV